MVDGRQPIKWPFSQEVTVELVDANFMEVVEWQVDQFQDCLRHEKGVRIRRRFDSLCHSYRSSKPNVGVGELRTFTEVTANPNWQVLRIVQR
jgi:hypothetical protein